MAPTGLSLLAEAKNKKQNDNNVMATTRHIASSITAIAMSIVAPMISDMSRMNTTLTITLVARSGLSMKKAT